jgi:hypothetical protein
MLGSQEMGASIEWVPNKVEGEDKNRLSLENLRRSLIKDAEFACQSGFGGDLA